MGLAGEYKARNETGLWLQWLFGLTLLTPEEAVECFLDEFMGTMPTDDDCIVSLVDYLYENYMKDGARFASYSWTTNLLSTPGNLLAVRSLH